MPLNQQAFRDGSLGILGALPPAYARRDGVLGALPPAHVVRDGVLGVLGAPPVSGSYNSGVFGALPPAPVFRDGSLGMPIIHEPRRRRRRATAMVNRSILRPTHGLGDGAISTEPMLIALGGLAVVATGWYLFNRKRRGRR